MDRGQRSLSPDPPGARSWPPSSSACIAGFSTCRLNRRRRAPARAELDRPDADGFGYNLLALIHD
ncbi:hypothetical protein [Thermochromatium tepidum]|uniref:Uncharacterized protein n=1 Tax=Thermochromatium tepidum ATCC 43061 TaxID=316276 RepID=A0A6I6E0P3_THETI|nr:hypothetical protein [Thermochromatium tepidum]QGU32515.1 hypothetical protein E6P07_05665 [Thermochromatium tepidum ATCC 43061]